MDRNLGAVSATPGADGALGLHYQWGRKDPFPGYLQSKANSLQTNVAITKHDILLNKNEIFIQDSNGYHKIH